MRSMNSGYKRQQSAFTLAEMAIVLVIIGLLVGAVTGGSSLLHQSELQSVIADYTKYSAAANQFTQQYGGPPGDIIDATSYWGTNSTSCTVPATNATPGTCNGDGDGQILTANLATVIPNVNEVFRAWQHLTLAKLIDGSFTGISGNGAGLQAVVGTNVPKSRISGAGWSFYYKGVTSGNSDLYNQDLGNYLVFGLPLSNKLTQAPAITASDAWQIDKKLDDTVPAYGRIMSFKYNGSSAPSCATSTTDASAQYNLTSNDIVCPLMMSLSLK